MAAGTASMGVDLNLAMSLSKIPYLFKYTLMIGGEFTRHG